MLLKVDDTSMSDAWLRSVKFILEKLPAPLDFWQSSLLQLAA